MIITIDDEFHHYGRVDSSTIIETDNRYEVVKRIQRHIQDHGRFKRDEVKFYAFLDDLRVEGVIKSYETKVMRLTFDEVWVRVQ